MESNDKKKRDLDESYRKTLNSHGYSFQYAVTKAAIESSSMPESPWMFDATEFPVSVNGSDTRIDLVLKRKDLHGYLIVECKRANPALSNWCFVRAPYVRRNADPNKLFAEAILFYKRAFSAVVQSDTSTKIYHIGTEVKSDLRGDSSGSPGRGAIEEAAGQVCRGVNGMVEFFSTHPEMLGSGFVRLVPAIFTSANIWTSDVNLADARIDDGILEGGTVTLKPEPWIWLNYNLSPALKHSAPGEKKSSDLSAALEAEYTKSIAIVSANGISDFLQRNWPFNQSLTAS